MGRHGTLAVDEKYRGQGLARQLVYEDSIRLMSSAMPQW